MYLTEAIGASAFEVDTFGKALSAIWLGERAMLVL
jgi:hypothetical protein